MADNIELPSGSGGSTVATDQVAGGEHYQLIKLAFGALDTANLVTSTTTNPFPVALSDTDNAVLDNIQTSVDALAAIIAGSELQVDIVGALPAGTNAIGKLAANSGVDIGDVDVTSLPGSITGYSEDAATPATIVGIPFVMERDDVLAAITPIEGDWAGPRCSAEGALWVQEFNSDAILADTASMDTNLATVAGAVAGTEMQVDIVSGNVTNAGTFAVQVDGDALTSLQTLDNIVATTDAVAGASPVGVPPLAVRDDALSALTPIEGDFVPLRTDANGALWVIPSGTVTVQEAAALDVSAATVTVAGTGTFAVQIDGAALNALQVIDNIVKVEDQAHISGDSGVPTLAVRQDTLGALAGTTLDYAPLQVNATGSLYVNVDDSSIVATEDGASGGAAVGVPAMAVRDDSLSALTPVEGDYVPLRVSSTGALHVTGGGGGTEYTEDVATANPIVGTATMMERDDVLAALTPIEGDWAAMRCSAEGALWTQDFNSDTMVTHLATLAGAVSTEMQVDIVGSLPAGTAAIGKLAANSGVDIGDVDVTSISAGSNLIGDVGISGARTSGGTTPYKNLDCDETADQIKASAGQIFWIHAMNLASSVRYLKLYNHASPTVGTTTPSHTFALPTQGDTNGAGFTLSIPNGIAFGTAISVAATTALADADTGAPGANEVVLNVGYA